MKPITIDQMMLSRRDDSLRRYLNDVSRLPLLTIEQEIGLTNKIKAGDLGAKDMLVRANLRFVVSCAKKYQNLGMEVGDLVNEGNLGLITAAEHFDPSQGFKFITYAVWWIRQSMMAALGRDARMIRLPMNRIKTNAQLRKMVQQLEQRLHREPTPEEISAELGLPVDGPSLELAFAGKIGSLDGRISQESELELWEATRDWNSLAPDEWIQVESDCQQVKVMLQLLDEREREILSCFFGLDGGFPLGYDEIGGKFGISNERVRQLKERAFQKIRKARMRAVRVPAMRWARMS